MPLPKTIWKKPLHFIAFGFGSGAMPFAPGTFGTLVGILFYLLLQPLSLPFYIVTVSVITLASIWICDRVEKEIHMHDHPGMCIDEIVGYLITMIAAPFSIVNIFLGFLLFRFFDIVKPPPIAQLDKHVQGGFGVMIDDIVAGIFSMIALQILIRVF